MHRIRLVIEYDGTDYVGWQTQPNGIAVQQVLEQELQKVTGEKIALHASGRTDSGVHAYAQVAHFDTESRIPADKFAYALNTGLPRDIRVIFSDACDASFHARFDVEKKHYSYRIYNAPHASAFMRNTVLHLHYPIDFDLLEREAADVIGMHDFAAFKAAGSSVEHTVRTIYESRWERDGALLTYHVAGSGFLYNMVRILVGTMLDVGMHRVDEGRIARAIASGRRADAGATAPACGLSLCRVEYADFDTNSVDFRRKEEKQK